MKFGREGMNAHLSHEWSDLACSDHCGWGKDQATWLCSVLKAALSQRAACYALVSQRRSSFKDHAQGEPPLIGIPQVCLLRRRSADVHTPRNSTSEPYRAIIFCMILLTASRLSPP